MQYRVTKGLITQKLDDKTVIFDGDESVLYTFNETASYIFNKIKAKVEQEKIVQLLVKRYGIKEERAKKDLKAIIQDMVSKKIISGSRK